MLYDVHLPRLLLHASLSLRISHASSHHAINEHYELELEATLREIWLQKLSKRVLSRPLTQLNPSCPWERVIWQISATGGNAVSCDVSFGGSLSFFRRAALDHVFPVAVILIVISSIVEPSWMTVRPSAVERTCLSFCNAAVPCIGVNGW